MFEFLFELVWFLIVDILLYSIAVSLLVIAVSPFVLILSMFRTGPYWHTAFGMYRGIVQYVFRDPP